jgi:hypothetical protein
MSFFPNHNYKLSKPFDAVNTFFIFFTDNLKLICDHVLYKYHAKSKSVPNQKVCQSLAVDSHSQCANHLRLIVILNAPITCG